MLGQAAAGRQKQEEKIEQFMHEKASRKGFVNTKTNMDHEYNNAAIQLRALKKEVDMDANERNKVEKSAFTYLNLAMDSYGVGLSQCSGATIVTICSGDVRLSSEVVFRFISLWFDNYHVSGGKMHEKVMPLLIEIPRLVGKFSQSSFFHECLAQASLLLPPYAVIILYR